MANFHGLLIIDKPSGITSRAAVDHVQAWFPRGTRIGHTGTLDPLASGVLVVCIGAATRLTEYVQAMPKVYRAGITLGATSDTDDADGTISPLFLEEGPAVSPLFLEEGPAVSPLFLEEGPAVSPLPLGEGPGVRARTPPTQDEIDLHLGTFIGRIQQVPPAYSAAKVTGRRAYALARKGHEVQLEPREVRIDRIDVLRYEYPCLEIQVRCGKGTYIRSLARDLGQSLGCGGYIASLRRLQVGSFSEAQAIALETDENTARSRMLPMWHAVQDYPPLVLLDEMANKLLQGQAIPIPEGAYDDVGDLVITDNAGRIFAVTAIVDGLLRPKKVMVLQ